MAQREDISGKYEFIYGTLAQSVAGYIASATTPPEETYATLKHRVPILWAATLEAYITGRQVPVEKQKEIAQSFHGGEIEWREYEETKKGTLADYYRSTDALFARTVLERVRGCDLVLDLGCGWGHRMVDLHLAGAHATFYGGDRSRHTRTLVKSVTGLFPAMRAEWFPFNYLAPDFSPIPTNFRRVALASWHAIEQVTTLGSGLFDAALSHFKDSEIIGVHIEPITFQLDPSYAQQRKYSERSKYNLDLYDVLRNHPGLTVTEAIPFICSHSGGPDAGLLTWRANR